MSFSRNPDWWRGAVIYQVYPRSFQDSNGDGIGDLPGITRRLPHIAELGADAVWLSPFFTSPMKDFGYDVSDYRDVDPMFGTLADFDELIERAHELGLKVMIDQVMSHTSDQHPWFAESRASKENDKADWYIWADAKEDGTAPNNWLSIFGGSAWQWDTRRCQYYMHNFLKEQPDLNFHNPAVREQLLSDAEFWLQRGVDGFRLDTVNFYFHDTELRDNPGCGPQEKRADGVPANNPYGWQYHVYDKSRPENIGFLEDLRALCDRYGERAMVGEIGADDALGTMAEYTQPGRLQMAYTFDLLSSEADAAHLHNVLDRLNAGIGNGWPCWGLSNHDVKRSASRWGGSPEEVALAAAFLLTIKGSVCVYQGEELGLQEADVPFELLQDPYGIEFWPEFKGRDGCRTPMVWESNALHGGFSSAEKTWLPVSEDHAPMAANQHGDGSALAMWKALLSFRRSRPELIGGDLDLHPRQGDVVDFTRRGDSALYCAFNFGDTAVEFGVPVTLGAKVGPGAGSISDGRVSLPPKGFIFVETA